MQDEQVLEYFLHIPNCVLFDVKYLKYFGLKVLLAHSKSRRHMVKDVPCRAQEDTWRCEAYLSGHGGPYKANGLTFTTVNNVTGIFFFSLGGGRERERERGAIFPMQSIQEYGVLMPVKFLFVTTCADRISLRQRHVSNLNNRFWQHLILSSHEWW